MRQKKEREPVTPPHLLALFIWFGACWEQTQAIYRSKLFEIIHVDLDESSIFDSTAEQRHVFFFHGYEYPRFPFFWCTWLNVWVNRMKVSYVAVTLTMSFASINQNEIWDLQWVSVRSHRGWFAIIYREITVPEYRTPFPSWTKAFVMALETHHTG